MNVYEARHTGRDYCCKTEGSDHYKEGGIEPLDLMIAKGLAEDFCIGNMSKYAFRFKKTRNLEDLKKVSDYAHILCGVELGKRGTADIIEQRIIADEQMEAEQREKDPQSFEELEEKALKALEKFCPIETAAEKDCTNCFLSKKNNGHGLCCGSLCQQHPQLALDLMQGKVGE